MTSKQAQYFNGLTKKIFTEEMVRDITGLILLSIASLGAVTIIKNAVSPISCTSTVQGCQLNKAPTPKNV